MTEIAQDDYQGAAPSRPLEIAFAAVALAVAAGYLVLATQIPLRREAAAGQIDARFWPTVIGTTAVVIAVLLLVIAITRPAPGREDIERIQRGGVLRVAITLVISIAFIALWSLGSVILFGYRIEIFPVAAGLLIGLWTATMVAFLFARQGWLFRLDENGWPRPKREMRGVP